MIRIFARRPLVFVALTMCLGIFLMVKGLEDDTLWWFIGIMLLLTILAGASFILNSFTFSKSFSGRALTFISVNRFIWLFCLIFYIVGGLFSFNKINYYSTSIENVDYTVIGTVVDVEEYYSSDIIYLKDVFIENNNSSIELKGKTQLVFNRDGNLQLSEVEVGNQIFFVGSITPVSAIVDGKLNYYDIKDDVRYSAQYSGNLQVLKEGSVGIDNSIRQNILENLLDNMPSSIAHLSFSILFGDSSYLSDFTNDAFKISGVAHIVAVSGMNVVIIVGLLMFLLKFIKNRKLLKFIIIALVLVGYCYLCDFTPSVVRATIMALVVLLAKFLGRQGDILSSLGLAFIIINIIWPLSIYDVGFLLSFASVIGIVFFCNAFTKFLRDKCKFPNFLASSIAVTVSAQIGIYPIMASYFNSFSLYSILANIVVVPIFSIAYVLLFASVIISYILPFLSFILVVPAVVMSFVNWFPTIFVNLPYANLYVFSLGVFSILYYVALVFISSFVFINHKIKIPITVALITAMIIYFVLDLLPNKFKQDNATNLNTYQSAVILTTKDNGKYLVGVGGSYDTNRVIDKIQNSRIYELNGIILLNSGLDAYTQRTNVEALADVCKINMLYVTNQMSSAFETLKDINVQTLPTSDVVDIKGGTLYPIYYQNSLVVVVFDLAEQDYAFVLDIDKNQAHYVKSFLTNNTKLLCYDSNDYEFFAGYSTVA